MLCIAGKNNIAVSVAKYVLDKFPKIKLVGIVNSTDNGIDGWQKSYKRFLTDNQIQQVSLEEIYNCNDLVFLSLEFDKIIKPNKFKTKRLYNIHFSLLPKYRGMYTSALPIIHNEKETGVTLHYIDSGIDTGDIIAQKKFNIDFADTAQDIYSKLIDNGTKLVIEWLPQLLDEHSCILAKKQNVLEASYFAKTSINYKHLDIDLKQCAVSVYNQIRAFHFRQYQLPYVSGMKISKCEITNKRSTENAGTITLLDANRLKIATIDYDVILYRDRFDELLSAIKANKTEIIKEIGQEKYYWQEKNADGISPLELLKELGNMNILHWLTEH